MVRLRPFRMGGCSPVPGDKFARVFSDTRAELFKMQHGGHVYSVCALPDGRLLPGSSDNFARVFGHHVPRTVTLQARSGCDRVSFSKKVSLTFFVTQSSAGR